MVILSSRLVVVSSSPRRNRTSLCCCRLLSPVASNHHFERPFLRVSTIRLLQHCSRPSFSCPMRSSCPLFISCCDLFLVHASIGPVFMSMYFQSLRPSSVSSRKIVRVISSSLWGNIEGLVFWFLIISLIYLYEFCFRRRHGKWSSRSPLLHCLWASSTLLTLLLPSTWSNVVVASVLLIYFNSRGIVCSLRKKVSFESWLIFEFRIEWLLVSSVSLYFKHLLDFL